jgi:beta-barrel assembly-enhancing protease
MTSHKLTSQIWPRTSRSCRALAALSLAALLASPFAASGAHAQSLPDLGDESQGTITPQMERSVGQQIFNNIRLRDPDYVDDPEVIAYLGRLASRLSAQVEGGISDVASPGGFQLFALRDATLNAFAMPGGYIGVHTGLILAAQSESELASVLGHEISHVTQHHISRGISAGSTGNLATILGLAVALLAARSNPELAMGAAMAGQAVGIQNQLNYSRDFEREADRLGLQLLERAEFDVRAAPVFFERLQKQGAYYEGKNAAPSYLRTHPMNTERIASLNDRINTMPYKQVKDAIEFQLVRARLRAQVGSVSDAVAEFTTQIEGGTAQDKLVAHYGLLRTHLRDNNIAAAERALSDMNQAIKTRAVSSPMFDTTRAELLLKKGDADAAVKLLNNSRHYYPNDRATNHLLVQAQLDAKQPQAALELSRTALQNAPEDARMVALQAKSYGLLGRLQAMHLTQAEHYVMTGQVPLALEQLEIAHRAGDGDFYEKSQVEARLREVRQMHLELQKEKRK